MAKPFQFRLRTIFWLTAAIAVSIPVTRWYLRLPSKPKLVKVRGTITLDGLPMKGAEITFLPTTPPVELFNGFTDEKGRFTTRTHPAPYVVVIDPNVLSRPGGQTIAAGSPTWTTPRLRQDGLWTFMLIVRDGVTNDLVWNLVTPVPKH